MTTTGPGDRPLYCSKCRYRVRRPGQRTCKECHAQGMRAWRALNGQTGRTDLQRERANARAYARVYLARGRLKRDACTVCGNTDTSMHHADYNRPLDVTWYCRDHMPES